jgi:hypothetical protein
LSPVQRIIQNFGLQDNLRQLRSIGLPAHGTARLPDDEFGSILAANAAKYAGFTDS